MAQRKDYFSSDFKLGILGGGQLGKMILTETRRYDIQTKVMDPSPLAPCRFGSNTFVEGDLNDEQKVLEFGADCDVLTIEIEGVNTKALKQLRDKGVKVFPKPETLELIKDKREQKSFYENNHIPTSSFIRFENKEEMFELIAKNKLEIPFVWKAATGGYDGRGVQIVRSKEDLENLPSQPGLIEDLVDFEKELAIIVARSENGESKSFPLVEMDFHPVANQVEFVFSPSLISQEIKDKASRLVEDLVEKLDHVGLLAVEMFLTKTGDILINEVAPRVHNSGHLSIEGNTTSQFEQHLRAVLDLPLGDTAVVKPSVMINLTGEEGYSGPVFYEGLETIMAVSGVYVHLYGKAETRPFRKMGHITVTANTLEEARTIAKKVKDTIKVISK